MSDPAADQAHNQREQEKYTMEVLRRMDVLKDFYGAGNWWGLAYFLAQQVVPGLRVAKGKPGRPNEKNAFDNATVRIEIEAMRAANLKLSLTQAFEKLAKSGRFPGKSKSVLKSMFYEASDPVVDLLRKASSYRWYESLPPEKQERAAELLRNAQ